MLLHTINTQNQRKSQNLTEPPIENQWVGEVDAYKAAARFRKDLEKDGFAMMQFSVYIRHCASRESLDVHIKRVKTFLPETGKVSILGVTDKQYGDIHNFWGKPKSASQSKIQNKVLSEPVQLELF